MAGTTVVVLVIVLIVLALIGPIVVAACFWLATRRGQGVKSVSLSPRNGFTAEFYPKRGRRLRDRTQSGPAEN